MLTINSILIKSCTEHISYILILNRNPKFDLRIHIGVVECCILFKVPVTMTSGLVLEKWYPRHISYIFKVAISNFMYGCILMLEIASFYFCVTVTLSLNSYLNRVPSISPILYPISLRYHILLRTIAAWNVFTKIYQISIVHNTSSHKTQPIKLILLGMRTRKFALIVQVTLPRWPPQL